MSTLTNITIENTDKDVEWGEATLTWATTRTWANFTEVTSIAAV